MKSPRLIDVEHLGRDRVIGAWVRDRVVIDPGPASCLGTLLGALGGERPRALLLTHIHLDHAGATGSLVERYPELPVYVHEVGAPHMVDPTRLLASAERLYGERMGELWGEVVPVPTERIIPLSGGEEVEGLRVLATPGHAAHHVCYLDEESGDAFVGDVCGVRIPPGDLTLMPTPPPEIDVEAWQVSLAELARWEPARLRITHYGTVEDAAQGIAAARESLARTSERAREGDRDRFLADVDAALAAQPDDVGDRLRRAMPPDLNWLGLERYWRKRAG